MDKKTTTQHKCLGEWTSNTNGADFDCGYNVPFSCDDCWFNKKPSGKKPWAKKWHS